MYPENLQYTQDHEWVDYKNPEKAGVGITTYAIEQLGDIVHIDLPKVGSVFKEGDSFGTIESTKTVSDLYMPLDGTVLNINSDLIQNPEKIQSAKNGEAWLIEVGYSNKGKKSLTSAEYQKFISES